LGHDCAVVAPSLIPQRPGDRLKTNLRDALSLTKLHRAGKLTPVWVPDVGHEAIRELVRARAGRRDRVGIHAARDYHNIRFAFAITAASDADTAALIVPISCEAA
jgi:transposase